MSPAGRAQMSPKHCLLHLSGERADYLVPVYEYV